MYWAQAIVLTSKDAAVSDPRWRCFSSFILVRGHVPINSQWERSSQIQWSGLWINDKRKLRLGTVCRGEEGEAGQVRLPWDGDVGPKIRIMTAIWGIGGVQRGWHEREHSMFPFQLVGWVWRARENFRKIGWAGGWAWESGAWENDDGGDKDGTVFRFGDH